MLVVSLAHHATARRAALVVLALAALPLLGACGGEPTGTTETPEDWEAPAALSAPLADPSPIEEGAWTTAQDYEPLGDPRARMALPERPYRVVWRSFPPTLRAEGPNANLNTTRWVHNAVYETLIGVHPETEAFIPLLASHWRIETDAEGGFQTFTYRIDESARFADGTPVTARDVWASFWHRVQKDRNDPSSVLTFGKGFHMPEIVDRLTIRVKTKELNWRLFLYFGGFRIYKADEIAIPGDVYLERYNWDLLTGTGPYEMTGLDKGSSLTLTRRDDWWADDEPWARNLYNFRLVRFEVIRDQEMEYERFKNGDLDFYVVSRAQRWVEDLPKEEKIEQGWIKKRKVYSEAPEGFAGLCFNMREWPFDDARIRLAFCHLFNREALMERLFFNEYEMMNSYFPGRDWGNGERNEPMYYDPDRAAELLAEAGYDERNADGYLVDDSGRVLEVTLRYGWQAWERIWLVVKEYYEDAGVKFNLELIDAATLQKKISERQFRIHFQSWGALLFPNPETSWNSELAMQDNNNNLPGFANERVDELCALYNRTLVREEQKAITREIDSIVYREHPYALGWFANFNRVLYWDRFGHPDHYWSRIGQYPQEQALVYWWWEPERGQALEAAMAAGESLPQGEVEVRPWAD